MSAARSPDPQPTTPPGAREAGLVRGPLRPILPPWGSGRVGSILASRPSSTSPIAPRVPTRRRPRNTAPAPPHGARWLHPGMVDGIHRWFGTDGRAAQAARRGRRRSRLRSVGSQWLCASARFAHIDCGALADAYGRARMLSIGCILFGAACRCAKIVVGTVGLMVPLHPGCSNVIHPRDHMTLRFSADDLPRLLTISNSTFCPSLASVDRPAFCSASFE
jgi:hypothetical protein